jgi:hypothetical protein
MSLHPASTGGIRRQSEDGPTLPIALREHLKRTSGFGCPISAIVAVIPITGCLAFRISAARKGWLSVVMPGFSGVEGSGRTAHAPEGPGGIIRRLALPLAAVARLADLNMPESGEPPDPHQPAVRD